MIRRDEISRALILVIVIGCAFGLGYDTGRGSIDKDVSAIGDDRAIYHILKEAEERIVKLEERLPSFGVAVPIDELEFTTDAAIDIDPNGAKISGFFIDSVID